ncbi:hypothetical protein DERF_014182 [Dermatophagoides farinae]|uniref:Uncharacterized protein n=1 Tax=Dermatophagoides farinae TaxID=6954 RepID=A0A922KWD8_DERFA|nr:hypothetical protein DERF_014182 [Dermatophagoides farinae]
MLLLKCSSKTAQRDLLYALQNSNQPVAVNQNSSAIQNGQQLPQRKIGQFVTRLLPNTNRPSRWFIENLLHELYRHQQQMATPVSVSLLQSLTLLARNEQLIKLNEMLSVFILKRIDEILMISNGSMNVPQQQQLYIVDLVKMLGNLNNYTAIESVHRKLMMNHSSSPSSTTMTFTTIGIIHAYRESINRLQVQKYLMEMFENSHSHGSSSSSSCQIRQEIVQLLINNVDRIFYNEQQQRPEKKRWPKYDFNQLDEILAQNLRNSSNNCVHHLIVEYFQRKTNKKSHQYIREYESKQNYDSASFDFCISESNDVKCDYVQKIGNDMIDMIVKKSISTPKPLSANQSLSIIYTKYSIDINLSSSSSSSSPSTSSNTRLTLGHLNVYQTAFAHQQQLRMEFDNVYNAETMLLGYWNITELTNRTKHVDIIQIKLNIPTIILWSKRYPHQLVYTKMMNVNILITLKKLIDPNTINHHRNQQQQPDQHLNHAKKQLKINFDIKTNVELMATSLAWKNSIELESRFQYESIQPISTDPFNNDHGGGNSRSHNHNHNGFVIESDNNNQSSANVHPFTEELFIENSLQYLGSEWFHHEIELFREFNKRFDPQCNTWIDESSSTSYGSYRQTISFWNSTLVQRNLLSLSLYEGQPDMD